MALPTLQRKLFQNDGYGPLLKDEIVSRHISVQDWSNVYDYPVATVARGSDGVLYYSKLQSGPGTGAGAVDPTTDDGTYWTAPKVPAMPSGDKSDAAASTKWVNQWLADSVITPPDVYVDPANGDDSNDGLTSSTAKQTIAACMELLVGANPIGVPHGTAIIHLAKGVYNESVSSDFRIPDLHFVGPSSGWATVKEIYVYNNQVLRIGGGNFRIANGGIVASARSGVLRLEDGLNINFDSWSASQAFYVFQGGRVYVTSGSTVNVSFTGSCSVSNAVLRIAHFSAFVSYSTLTWSGSVTGKKYNVYGLGFMSGVGSSSAIPGTVAGTVDSSSVFLS